MNANRAGSRAKVSLGLGLKNPTKEDSDLKSATSLLLSKNASIPRTNINLLPDFEMQLSQLFSIQMGNQERAIR